MGPQPHLCRTLTHRVVRVGRLLQTRPKVSGVVCHRNYCPGLLTHGYGHPSIGNYRYIQPQDSSLRLIRRRVSLASRSRPAPEVPGNTSKTRGTPRKYQSGPSSWPRGRAPCRDGVTGILIWDKVGIMAAWFAVGIWTLSACTGSTMFRSCCPPARNGRGRV